MTHLNSHHWPMFFFFFLFYFANLKHALCNNTSPFSILPIKLYWRTFLQDIHEHKKKFKNKSVQSRKTPLKSHKTHYQYIMIPLKCGAFFLLCSVVVVAAAPSRVFNMIRHYKKYYTHTFSGWCFVVAVT